MRRSVRQGSRLACLSGWTQNFAAVRRERNIQALTGLTSVIRTSPRATAVTSKASDPQHRHRPEIVGLDQAEIRPEIADRLLHALRIDPAATAGTRPAQPERLEYGGPSTCYLPDWLEGGRGWGITTQLYELRSKRSWGIGDFEDLRLLAEIAGRAGADFLGVTPLHATFLAEPERCSPFSPSNRRFLNPLYIAVDKLPGYGGGTTDEREELQRLAAAELVDYRAVAKAKLLILRKLWQGWQTDPEMAAEHKAFRDFTVKEGRTLADHALFEALSAEMVSRGYGAGWTTWPEPFQEVRSPDTRAYAQAHTDEAAFHNWLQWIAGRQLAAAATTARQAGMRIGLYLDLAVGEAPDGSAVWSDRNAYLDRATIGAPPDYFSADGQEWGLTVMVPSAIVQDEAATFRTLIEHAARHGGALRLDHVMSLWQLFVIPAGLQPRDGAFVRYPVGRLLQELASASRQAGFIVVGEDLGYVPEGFRDVMTSAGVLSYRILYFEKAEDGRFLPAVDYPALSIACVSTHDLPTLAGWWRGDDIRLRLEHGLIDKAMAETQTQERKEERHHLVAAIAECDAETRGTDSRPKDEPLSEAVAVAVHRFLARSSAILIGVRLADLVGETMPTNLPGTVDAYPNWRRRCPLLLEELEDAPRFAAITRAVAAIRPRP